LRSGGFDGTLRKTHSPRALNLPSPVEHVSFVKLSTRGRWDIWNPLAILGLCGFGVCFIYSAQLSEHGNNWIQQLVFLLVGGLIYLGTSLIDYRFWLSVAHWFYLLCIIPLVYVLLLGSSRYGATRWIDLGFFSYQPSETAKVAVLLIVAAILIRSEIGGLRQSVGVLGKLALAVGLPMLLILLQPDLKSAIVLPPLVLSMLYVSKLSTRFFLCVFGADRPHRRAGGLPEHRVDPAVRVLADQYRTVLARTVFPLEAACRDRRRRDQRGGDHGVDVVVPGDPVSILARGAARSGRSAALRMSVPMEEVAEEVPVVYLHDIKRQYVQGESVLTILGGAKLALWAGQSVALVAPSGSGKSTLLHIAGLLEHPDEGEVYISGTATSGLSDAERTQIRRTDIGFVYQSHRLLPEFSALENVMLPQMIRGLKRSETVSRSKEILGYLGLGDRITHRPAELSGGEQQRVAIARAVANAPRVLLADEPTGNLDPHTADHVFQALMQLVRATQVAMLIATHNMELAHRMDRRVSIQDGQVIELD